MVLITGALGFIGKVVLLRLLEDFPGARVVIVARGKHVHDRKSGAVTSARERVKSTLAKFYAVGNPLARIEVAEVDLEQTSAADIFARPTEVTHVINCAASISFGAESFAEYRSCKRA